MVRNESTDFAVKTQNESQDCNNMTNKKKNKAAKQQKLQQKKQHRRHARVERRKPIVRPAAGKPSLPPDPALIDDMLPLFPKVNERNVDPESLMTKFLEASFETEDFLDEPEFADIDLDPFNAMKTYIEIAEEQGLAPSDFDQMDEDDRTAKIEELLDLAIERLLTPQLCKEFHKGFTALRHRLRSERRFDDLALVAAAQTLLDDKESPKLVTAVGVIRRFVNEQIQAGFALGQELMEMEKDQKDNEFLTPEQIYIQINESSVVRKLEKVIGRIPGLRRILEKQVDKISEEGRKAVFTGELDLQIYSETELDHARQIVEDLYSVSQGSADSGQTFLQQHGKEMIYKLDEYIEQLFTPERLEQLRQYLLQLTRDPAYGNSKWLAFLLMLQQAMAEEDGALYERRFLITALMGEMSRKETNEEEYEGSPQ